MGHSLDFFQLERYFAGACSPEELAGVVAWMDAEPSRRGEVEQLRIMFEQAAGADTRLFDARAALQRTTDRFMQLGEMCGTSIRPRPRSPSRHLTSQRRYAANAWRIVATAAAAAVVIGLAFEGGLVSNHPRHPVREFATAPGNKATVTLLDGTRVVLGPDTRLRVAADYGVGARTIDLDGEAFFTVVHDAVHPLTVRTRHTQVRDVGTVFDIRAYADEPDTRVAVAEGTVALGATFVHARDLAVVDAGGAIVVHPGVSLAQYTDWVQGRLVFDDTPLRDVVRDIGRAYGVEIRVADSALTTNQVTTAFDREPLEQVLDEITSIVGAEYERTGRVIVIRRRSAPIIRHQHEPAASLRVARTGRAEE